MKRTPTRRRRMGDALISASILVILSLYMIAVSAGVSLAPHAAPLFGSDSSPPDSLSFHRLAESGITLADWQQASHINSDGDVGVEISGSNHVLVPPRVIRTLTRDANRHQQTIPHQQHQQHATLYACVAFDDAGAPSTMTMVESPTPGGASGVQPTRCGLLPPPIASIPQPQPPHEPSRPAEVDTSEMQLRWEHETTTAIGSADFIRWSSATLAPTDTDVIPLPVESDIDHRRSHATHFRYSLFAEWQQPTAVIDAQGVIRIRSQRQNIRICQVDTSDNADQSQALGCEITHMPRGVDIVYTLLVACVGSSSTLIPDVECHPALSPSLRLRLELDSTVASVSQADSHQPTRVDHKPPVRVEDAPTFDFNIDRIANDTEVRADLELFYQQTSGPRWGVPNHHWLSLNVSLCDWAGITCDSNRSMILVFDFSSFNGVPFKLMTTDTPLNLSILFQHVTTLQSLNLSTNTALCLDQPGIVLTEMITLMRIDLTHLGGGCNMNGRFPRGYLPIFLPTTSYLEEVHLSSSRSKIQDANIISFPMLTILEVDTTFSFPLAAIKRMPSLNGIFGVHSIESSTPDEYGRSGGDLTHDWLNHLDTYNPSLTFLELSGPSALSFEREENPTPGTNFPIIHSSSVTHLTISNLLQLYSNESGLPHDWLSYLPSLVSLKTLQLSNCELPLSTFFEAGSNFIEELCLSTLDSTTRVSGSITSILHFSQLRILYLSSSVLNTTLPSNLDTYWPSLEVLVIQNAPFLQGTMPTMQNMINLTTVDLSGCGLYAIPEGMLLGSTERLVELHLERNFLSCDGPLFPSSLMFPMLTGLYLDHNRLASDLASLFLPGRFPQLVDFVAHENALFGTIPSNLWDVLPKISAFVVSQNPNLNGPIPSASRPTFLEKQIAFANNPDIIGTFPANLTSNQIDYSYTSISGPVVITMNVPTSGIDILNLAFTYVTCPLDTSIVIVRQLYIQSARFDGCDFNDPADVNIRYTGIQAIDISYNRWLSPFPFLIMSSSSSIRAVNASITSLDTSRSNPLDTLSISSVDFSRNPFLPGLASGMDAFLNLYKGGISFFACNECQLDGTIQDFLQLIFAINTYAPSLYELRLADNGLTGELPSDMLSNTLMIGKSLQRSIRVLDLSNNPIIGFLPATSPIYTELASLDLSGTGLMGELPESWGSFIKLQNLGLHDTLLHCRMTFGPDGDGLCDFPTWLTYSPSHIDMVTASTNGQASSGYHCPAVFIKNNPTSMVTIDTGFYDETLCECAAGWFGTNGDCQQCPTGCTCQGDVITDCFPMIELAVVESGVLDSFAIPSAPLMLLCPSTITGARLCNPRGMSFTGFFQTIELVDMAKQLIENALAEFCYTGHTDRLCSRCADGYFASGRWCLECGSPSLHVFIVIANLAVLIVLIVFLYIKMPSGEKSTRQLRQYITTRFASNDTATSSSLFDRATYAQSGEMQPATMATPIDTSQSSEELSAGSDQTQRSFAEAPSPLKLLIFHSQQLSLLLSTSTSQPAALTGLLSVVSASSTGFSLSSLLALECLNGDFDLAARCWLGVLAAGLVGIVAVGMRTIHRIGVRDRGTGRTTNRTQQPQGDEEIQTLDQSNSGDQRRIWQVIDLPRLYGVCVSLLYLFVFPCAQTALSALACTDTREVHNPAIDALKDKSNINNPNHLPTAPPTLIYLNLHPWQACDAEWRRTILPPAIIGVIIWFVAFPIATTILSRRLHKRLTRTALLESTAASSESTINESSSSSSSSSTSSSDAPLDAAIWPICSDLFTPYRREYWFYDQILLLRRLALVLCVSMIPADSLYLPLCLFVIIQLSALTQHVAQPYDSIWMNRAEMASLYLLLMNYITAIILQGTTVTGVDGHQLDPWTLILFLANIVFILILVCGLFLSLRSRFVLWVDGRRRARHTDSTSPDMSDDSPTAGPLTLTGLDSTTPNPWQRVTSDDQPQSVMAGSDSYVPMRTLATHAAASSQRDLDRPLLDADM